MSGRCPALEPEFWSQCVPVLETGLLHQTCPGTALSGLTWALRGWNWGLPAWPWGWWSSGTASSEWTLDSQFWHNSDTSQVVPLLPPPSSTLLGLGLSQGPGVHRKLQYFQPIIT